MTWLVRRVAHERGFASEVFWLDLVTCQATCSTLAVHVEYLTKHSVLGSCLWCARIVEGTAFYNVMLFSSNSK